MAKFVYHMQSVLNIKEKLEEQAKNQFAVAKKRLDEEQERLNALRRRREEYMEEGVRLRNSTLNMLDLRENRAAVEKMDEYIKNQQAQIIVAQKNLDSARVRLQKVMQERKMQEKLREKAFEEFKYDLNKQESKEIDELTSYTYGLKTREQD
ncbi:MAG: flagellar export protein FliJ [Lachnospiraceae bacterium]|nr:flagellar export protein FliJ [Lachnospiraceae bacterium]